jgi:hypothetical protein
MTPLDYGRSFILGKVPSNEVRFWVESRTRLIDEKSGREEDYIQTGSCKSEDTFAASNLFYDDNYDFMPVFGPEYGLIYRRKAWLNPGYRSIVRTEEMWDGQIYHLIEARAYRELHTPEEILETTRDFLPLVSQTEIRDESAGMRALIECPVKTMNTRRSGQMYQVDTGPVMFPDLSVKVDRNAEHFFLAFLAFNARHFTDFVLEVPTEIGDKGERIHHYSRRLSLAATNRLFAIEQG